MTDAHENEASLNLSMERQNKHSILGPQMPLKASCSKKKKKSFLFSTWDNRHFPEDDAMLFQWKTQTPNGAWNTEQQDPAQSQVARLLAEC